MIERIIDRRNRKTSQYMKCVIIVPTYNEVENVVALCERVAQIVPDAHLLLMDDNSPDSTADTAETLFADRPEYANYRVVRRTGARGLGRAYCDGFQRALRHGYDRIIQMDADLSHDPKYLPALLEASHSADLVIGSRYCMGGGVRCWAWYRVLLSRFANWYVHKMARIPVLDATAGFRCWTRQALEAIQIDTVSAEGYSFQVEMSHRAAQSKLKIVEVPIVFTDRQFGQSKISRSVMIESFLTPIRLRNNPWNPVQAVVHSPIYSENENRVAAASLKEQG